MVGEIGRSHQEFMYDLRLWQLRMIVKGYYRRNRDMWSAVRWQTYNLMSVSMADLKKAGIYKPTDLIQFPWDNTDEETGDMPSDAEVQRLRQLMMEENARAEAGLPPDGDFTRGGKGTG